MSCFLCDSYYHVSQYCNKYISDEDRKSIVLSKMNSLTNFFTGLASKKCYICCSRNHTTLFCPDRFTASHFFVPNIDKVLFQRFLVLFDPYEKILLAWQSPSLLNESILQPLTIMETIKYNRNTALPNIQTNIVICKNFELCENLSGTYWEFYGKILSKTCAAYLENIKLSNIRIASSAIYLLLSSRTKTFKILHIEISSKFTLDEIFNYAPNLEEFEFEFEILQDRTWQNTEFFQHKYGKMFKKLIMTINCNFDIAKLIPFVNKGPSNVEISVYACIFSQLTDARLTYLQEISKYFVFAEVPDNQFFSLYLRIKNPLNEANDEEHTYAGTFALKN